VSQKDQLLVRLEYVIMRLEAHALAPARPGLTEPDQPSGERWEWGQVWAHVAEFIPYWMGEIRSILAGPADEPAPFGRTKTDPDRIAAIERDRGQPVAELWNRMQGHLAGLWNFLDDLPADAWSRQGLHPTLGAMSVSMVADEMLVGHLEQHAAQLDGLEAHAAGGTGSMP
jgi:DinB superfamily